MHLITLIFLLVSIPVSFGQMSETEQSDACMNQILAGLTKDKILGSKSGICVKLNKDDSGNISGMDFNLKSSAFELGKDGIKEEQAARLQTIKQLVIDYQKTVTKKNDITIDDVDIQVKSYADGVGGPTSFDEDIKKFKNWGELSRHIGADQKSLDYLHNSVPASKNPKGEVKFDSLNGKAKSLIRNIVLGKKRSEAICRQFGQKDCDKKGNEGFASPELEDGPESKKNCPERRVSVIKVNLTKASQNNITSRGEFHPGFQIPQEAGYKTDMQLAATFEIFKKHQETISRFSTPEARQEFKAQLLAKPRTAVSLKQIAAIDAWDPNSLSILDLPDSALASSEALIYAGMMSRFTTKFKQVNSALAVNPEMKSVVEGGQFIKFKQLQTSPGSKQISATGNIANILTGTSDNEQTTDLFNFFSAGQAMQYQFLKQSNSPYLTRADQFMNQSNGTLAIKFDSADFHGAAKGNTPAPVELKCHGGCETGVKEDPNGGEFITKYRGGLNPKNASQISKEFPAPTSFGALKALNVYTIKNCANCGCLKDPNVSMDSVLNDSTRTIKVSISKMTRRPGGPRGFSQDVGVIENPSTTCLFTPPVAHTCKVKPEGGNNQHAGLKTVPNFSCPFYDKTTHGIKWAGNFMQEALGIAANANKSICDASIDSLKDQAKGAQCDQSEPDDVPVSCQ